MARSLFGSLLLAVLPAILGIARFTVFLGTLIAVFFGLTYLSFVFGEGTGHPLTYSQRPEFWYLNPIIWIWLLVSFFFAGFLDYPRFRIWHRLDRALVAGFCTAIVPPAMVGLYITVRDGELVSPFTYPTPFELCCDGRGFYFDVASHILAGCLVCSFRWFMPMGPSIWPYGFLYRYLLLGVFIIAFYYLHTITYLASWR